VKIEVEERVCCKGSIGARKPTMGEKEKEEKKMRRARRTLEEMKWEKREKREERK
jgi:hypothetical protein